MRARADAGSVPGWAVNALTCAADGYPFPTNLDRDPNVDGLTPRSQLSLLQQALDEGWDADRAAAELDAYATRHRSEA